MKRKRLAAKSSAESENGDEAAIMASIIIMAYQASAKYQ
jgi:hypothetical protein